MGWLLRKALVEQPQQKVAVEGEEFPLALALLDHLEAMLEIVGGLDRLTRYSLPDLHGPGSIDKNDEMLVSRFGDLGFQFAAGSVVGKGLAALRRHSRADAAGGIGLTLEDLHTAFFGNSV